MSTNPESTEPGTPMAAPREQDEEGTTSLSRPPEAPEPGPVHPPTEAFRATRVADESLAGLLAERGILYAPDFIANAGGLIHVYREIKGYSEERAVALAEGIEQTLKAVLQTAAERGASPLAAARERARERLGAVVRD